MQRYWGYYNAINTPWVQRLRFKRKVLSISAEYQPSYNGKKVAIIPRTPSKIILGHQSSATTNKGKDYISNNSVPIPDQRNQEETLIAQKDKHQSG
jgi:hypothetical protein